MSSDAFDTARQPPRPHHHRFKYAVVERALDQPRELISLCASPLELRALWDEIGGTLAGDESVAPTGLAAQNVGDGERPVVMITLPAPERPNEAYYLCALPTDARLDDNGALFVPDPVATLELRIFGMERSVLPDGGLIGFVVEWTGSERFNYDAPDDPSIGAFWRAILAVVGGSRPSIHTTPR